jgi:hypothetical protein
MQYSYSSASRRSSHHDLRRPIKAAESDAKGKPNDKFHPTEPLSPSSTISGDRSSNGRPVIYRTQTSSDVGDATSPLFSTGHSPGSRKPSSARSNSPAGPMARVLPPRLSLPWLNNASMPGGSTHHRIPAHYPPQQNMYQYDKGPVPYPPPPPPHQFNALYLGPNTNQSSPPSFRGNMSTSSQSAGPSTVESGPPTPIHALGHGYSPALSKRSSFDRSAQISATHSRDGSFERKDIGPPHLMAPMPQMEEPIASVQYTHSGTPERNGVDIGKIQAGLDTRTTVMLKVCCYRFNQMSTLT